MSASNKGPQSHEGTRRVWFKIVEAKTGQIYTGTSLTSRDIGPPADIDTFRKKVYFEFSHLLRPVHHSQLLVYETESFNKRKANGEKREPISPGQRIGSMGKSHENPLIVVVPSKYNDDRISWGDEVEKPKSNLLFHESQLRFFKQEEAVLQLMKIHRDDFNHTHSGPNAPRTIPLLESIDGMGQFAFARNYLSEACKLLGSFCCSREFRHSMETARTIVLLIPSELLFCPTEDAITQAHFAIMETLRREIEYPPCPIRGSTARLRAYIRDGRSSSEAISMVIEETELPLFLVIDILRNPFDVDLDRNSCQLEKDRFLGFCRHVVTPLLKIPNLHFLLIDRADFLELVPTRNPLRLLAPSSEVQISRIGMRMIGREHIPDMLTRTIEIPIHQEIRLDDLYGINPDTGVDVRNEILLKQDRFIEALLDRTNGHPTSILFMIGDSHWSFDIFIKSAEAVDGPYIHSCAELDRWFVNLVPYQRCIRELLSIAYDCVSREPKERQGIDLTAPSDPDIRDSICLAQVTQYAYMLWDGELENARVFVPRAIRQRLSAMFMPFRTFISDAKIGSGVTEKGIANFKRCCQKRFQELFSGDSRVDKARIIEKWFSKTKVFLELTSTLKLSEDVSLYPRIESDGDNRFRSLNQTSAQPEIWPDIRKAMVDGNECGCYIARDGSASTDVIFISKPVELQGELYIVTIGIAVHCDPEQPMIAEMIDDEKKKFNRMFLEPRSVPLMKQVNILIVCDTGSYSDTLVSDNTFHTVLKRDRRRFKCIDETLLLNLSSPSLRKEFFGLTKDEQLAANLEAISSNETDTSNHYNTTE